MKLWNWILTRYRNLSVEEPLLQGEIASIQAGATQTQFKLKGDSATYLFIEPEFDPRYAGFGYRQTSVMHGGNGCGFDDRALVILVKEMMRIEEPPIIPGTIIQYRLTRQMRGENIRQVDLFRRASNAEEATGRSVPA